MLFYEAKKTKEQQEYYNKIITNAALVKKTTTKKIIVEKSMKITDYMRNCIYWIKQYFERKVSYNKYWSVTESLKQHIKECYKKVKV